MSEPKAINRKRAVVSETKTTTKTKTKTKSASSSSFADRMVRESVRTTKTKQVKAEFEMQVELKATDEVMFNLSSKQFQDLLKGFSSSFPHSDNDLIIVTLTKYEQQQAIEKKRAPRWSDSSDISLAMRYRIDANADFDLDSLDDSHTLCFDSDSTEDHATGGQDNKNDVVIDDKDVSVSEDAEPTYLFLVKDIKEYRDRHRLQFMWPKQIMEWMLKEIKPLLRSDGTPYHEDLSVADVCRMALLFGDDVKICEGVDKMNKLRIDRSKFPDEWIIRCHLEFDKQQAEEKAKQTRARAKQATQATAKATKPNSKAASVPAAPTAAAVPAAPAEAEREGQATGKPKGEGQAKEAKAQGAGTKRKADDDIAQPAAKRVTKAQPKETREKASDVVHVSMSVAMSVAMPMGMDEMDM